MASKAKKEESTDYRKFIKEHYAWVHKFRTTNPRTIALIAAPDNNETVTTFDTLESSTNVAMQTLFGRSVWETKVWVAPTRKLFSSSYEFWVYATVMFGSKELADKAYKELKEILDE